MNLNIKLNRSNAELRTKFLDGFPESFDVVIINERLQPGAGNYVFPAVYPAHHPQSGNPHPNSGEPDIMAMAMGFYPEWSKMLSNGRIKRVPRGMAHQTEDIDQTDDSEDEYETADLVKTKVKRDMVCLTCGGLGHASKVEGVGKCLTKLMGHQVPKPLLIQIKYPGNITRPNFDKKPIEKGNAINKHRGRPFPPRPRPKSPHPRSRIQPKRNKKHAHVAENHDENPEEIEEDQQPEEQDNSSSDDEEQGHLAIDFDSIAIQ